ncbi:MAG: hypothetical protein AB2421_12640 [Thermotaleaceae bacterium]
MTYEGLLDLAHQQDLESIAVDIVQLPSENNAYTAVCKATIKGKDKLFSDFGDASPNSVRSNLTPHIIRMASTRAKARALRDFTNIGMTAFEELDLKDLEDGISSLETSNKTIESSPIEDPPTQRQVETIKKLSGALAISVNLENLTKRTAGELISKMLDEKYKRH